MKKISLISGIRDIKTNISRFIAIFAIAAIGVGFFAGVRAAKPDMNESANEYYESQKLMDFSITSVEGFTDDDINMINEQVESTVDKAYTFDGMTKINGSDRVVKFYSLSNKMNVPKVVKGRLPVSADECVADANNIETTLKIGDEITIPTSKNQMLKNQKIKVVGLVSSAMYISGTQYGSTNLGNGQIDTVLFLNPDAFEGEYNTVYVRCDFLRDYNCYSDDYKDKLKSVVQRLDAVMDNRLESIVDGTYDYRKLDLYKHNPSLVDSANSIYDKKEELDEEYNYLISTKEYLERTEKLIEQKSLGHQQALEETENYITEEVSKYDSVKESIAKLRTECETAQTEYETVNGNLTKKLSTLDVKKYDLSLLTDKNSKDYIALQNEINKLQAEIDALNLEVKQKETVYKQKSDALNSAFSEYDVSYSSVDKILNELQDKNKITSDELVKMTISYRSAKADYDNRLTIYNKAREELTASLNGVVAAVSEIYSNYDKLWYFNSRLDLPGNAEYGDNAERIGNIAIVFPAFFLIVAMLVCLTSMTRLVSDHRLQIGTLKALGYSNLSIATRYIIYALIATLLGCAVGLVGGFVLFPRVILYAYSMLYSIDVMNTPFRVDIAIISSLLMCLCVVFSVLIACYSEFTNTPSKLMRPKPVPAGKRIFLDRIKFIWNKLSFTQKLTARNMFINKKRKIMTIIGVAGCTALLLTGLGLRDSISDIIDKQFNSVMNYDFAVYYTNKNGADSVISKSDVDDSIMCYQKNHEISNKDNVQDAYVVVPEHADKFGEFISLTNRKTGEKYNLKNNQCLITEKLAKLLNVNKGDSITLNINDAEFKVNVNGVVENYAYHYVYLSNDLYTNLTKSNIEYNTAFCKYDGKNEDEVAKSLLKSGKIKGVNLNSDSEESFTDIIKILNIVVMVLIISAAALSFVVVYNLSDINITERKREIATVKVLGFTKKEAYKYIFDENIILSLIGTAVGLGLGYLLAMYVINTAEINEVMFGRTIYPLSFVLSALLSIIFTFVISLMMRPKLNKVNMVEALKSVE